MSRVVSAASLEEKQKLRGKEWMNWWVDQLGNKEMAALVKRLPLDLPSKLQWMKAEGSSWGLMKDVIESVPAAERTKVVEDDSLRGFFVSECNDREMYEAVKLLGGRLSKQLAWMAAEDCEDGWVKERITTLTDPKDRLAVYSERLAWDRLLKLSDARPRRDGQAARRHARPAAVAVPERRQHQAADVGHAVGRLGHGDHEVPQEPARHAGGRDPRSDRVGAVRRAAALEPVPELPQHHLPRVPHEGVLGGVRQRLDVQRLADHALHRRADRQGAGRRHPAARRSRETSSGPATPTTAPRARSWSCSSRAARAAPAGSRARSWRSASSRSARTRWTAPARGSRSRRATSPTRGSSSPSTPPAPATSSPLGVDTGTPTAVGTGLNFFENHARHEIGHAVGARKIGATWRSPATSSPSATGAGRSRRRRTSRRRCGPTSHGPPTGWPAVPILGANVTLKNQDVHDWCMDVMAKGTEPSNPIGNTPGDLQDKLAAIQGSLWGGVRLVNYMVAIGARDVEGHARQRVRVRRVRPDRPGADLRHAVGQRVRPVLEGRAQRVHGHLVVRPVLAAGDVRRDVHRPLCEEGAADQGRAPRTRSSSSARSRASAIRCSGARSDDALRR